MLSCSTISQWIFAEKDLLSVIRRPALLSPLAIRGAVSGGRGLWVALAGTAETCAAQVGCFPSLPPHLEWAGWDASWPPMLAPSQCCNGFSLPRNTRQSPQHTKSGRVLAGSEAHQQRLSIFRISLLLCILPYNPYYLNETIFLEALSCWEETSCCGH